MTGDQSKSDKSNLLEAFWKFLRFGDQYCQYLPELHTLMGLLSCKNSVLYDEATHYPRHHPRLHVRRVILFEALKHLDSKQTNK